VASSTGPIFRNARLSAAALLCLAATALQAAPADTLTLIPTPDGISLAADYHPATGGKGVIVMLHGLDSNRGEWNGFSYAAQTAGWGTLAYDARGHGQSVRGAARGHRSFGPAGPGTPWERMTDDLRAVLAFLEARGVSASSVAVVGASLGANVAARYASRGAALKAVVLMSPGLNYMEFRPDRDVQAIRPRTLIITSPEDRYAFASSYKLRTLAPQIELWSDVRPGHGVDMFDETLSKRLLVWLSP